MHDKLFYLIQQIYEHRFDASIKSIKTFMFQSHTGYAYGQFAGYQQAGYMGYVYEIISIYLQHIQFNSIKIL